MNCVYFLTKNILIKEYIKNKKSTHEIAKQLKCSSNTIRRRLKKYNIKIRSISEALKGRFTGKNHPMYHKSMNAGENNGRYIDNRTHKKYYCIDCGNEINWQTWWRGKRRCKSCSKKGKLCPLYGKIGTHGNGGYYKNIYMRSSWEIKFAQFLSLSGIKWLYEPKIFDLGNSTYRPDFYILEFDCYIEIKGYWRGNAKRKFKLFKKLYPKVRIEVLMKKDLKNLCVL